MDIKVSSSTVLFSCIFLAFIHVLRCMEHDLTVAINPGATECFFVPVEKEMDIEVEFQVIDGGDLDINFYATDPQQRMLAAQMKKSEATHRFAAKVLGDYKICFDNSFSRFTRKVVYFEIISTDEDEDSEDDDSRFGRLRDDEELLYAKELMDVKLDTFQSMVASVRSNLDKSIQHQAGIRHHEARDRNVVEANFSHVNIWSFIQLFVMISVALVQVIMIRNFFGDNSKTSKIKERT